MDEMPTDGFRHRPLWLLGVAGLVLAQTGLILSLFGPDRSWEAVRDDRPVLSGRHPLHLYHGTLGAHAFCRRGGTTCDDPGFQAGYPKTPVFDGGCRPAELFLAIGGGGYSPAAYKVGLFACLAVIPLAFVLAARGAGLPAGAAVLAGTAGTVLGWSWPVRQLIDEGEIDFLAAGLGVIVFTAWMGRYARSFGVDSWLVLAATTAAGWYAHPVVWVGLVPVIAGYYLVLAPRKELAWHLGLVGITAAGLVPNLWWLADWGRYWWLRQPSPGDHIPLPTWDAVLGTPGDYLTLAGYIPYGGLLALAGIAGLVIKWRTGCRTSMSLLVVTTGITVALARLLSAWPRVPADAPERLAPLAAGLLALPAAFGLWKVLSRGGLAVPTAVAAVAGLLVIGWADGPGRPLARAARLQTDPLLVGLSTSQEQVVNTLRTLTTPDARVLWDETTDHRPGWNWTALLPVLTGRAYLGGLDHDANMEYSFCEMRDGRLNGRGLAEWTDRELGEFCRRYNVGWVVCRSPAAADRWGRVPGAAPVARLAEGGQPVVVYALARPKSFVLTGSARWEEAVPNRIVLTDVVPDADGRVTLSLHYIHGLRVFPSYIELYEDPDKDDPLGNVWIRPHGPVPRVTLVWENP